jgi:predicted transcriptional regulator
VALPTGKRKELMDTLKIGPQTLTNSLRSLKEKGLIHGDGGIFMINLEVMWRGSMKEREKLLKDKTINVHLKFVKHD